MNTVMKATADLPLPHVQGEIRTVGVLNDTNIEPARYALEKGDTVPQWSHEESPEVRARFDATRAGILAQLDGAEIGSVYVFFDEYWCVLDRVWKVLETNYRKVDQSTWEATGTEREGRIPAESASEPLDEDEAEEAIFKKLQEVTEALVDAGCLIRKLNQVKPGDWIESQIVTQVTEDWRSHFVQMVELARKLAADYES